MISIIVPIYNVSLYLRKCLNSLNNQTMDDIEVICIDDGSTDGSGDIVDEYAGNENFRIYHTENRGLSAARNRGIDEARGDWIMFVDSDDWVDERFCEIPYKIALENNADLVIFDYYNIRQNGKVRRSYKSDKIITGIVSTESVIFNGIAWNKLYKKRLFSGIHFPEDHVCEDIATTHKIIHRAARIYQSDKKLYYYRNRRGSISKTKSNKLDAYIARVQRYKDLVELGYVAQEDKTILQMASLDYCGQAVTVDEYYYRDAASIVDKINGIPDGFDRKYRLKLLLWRINKRAYRGLYRILGKQMKQVYVGKQSNSI